MYIAGPYTFPDPEGNTGKAILVADLLLDHGYIPFIPHLTHYWNQRWPHDYETWLAYAMAWLPVCDCLLRLGGISPGRDREEDRARELGKPVFNSIPELLQGMPPVWPL